MKEVRMKNGEVVNADGDPSIAGMKLRCTRCEDTTDPTRKDGDPKTVVRCAECGKRHSTQSLEYDPDA